MVIGINEWLSKQTDENLREYLPYCDRMILASTIAEAGAWIERKQQAEREIARRTEDGAS